MRYFKFTVMRGHLGAGYLDGTITFYETGRNLLQAMDKAKSHGGVKHNRIPLNGMEISKAEFEIGRRQSAYVRARVRPRG